MTKLVQWVFAYCRFRQQNHQRSFTTHIRVRRGLCIHWINHKSWIRIPRNISTHRHLTTFKNYRRLRRVGRQEDAKPQAVHRVSLKCTRCIPHADIQAVSHCSSTDSHIALGHHGNKLSIVDAAILKKENKIRLSSHLRCIVPDITIGID